jgi:hypothetical protein
MRTSLGWPLSSHIATGRKSNDPASFLAGTRLAAIAASAEETATPQAKLETVEIVADTPVGSGGLYLNRIPASL